MIFVTVGTHEQPFNRLLEYIDNLKKDGRLTEEVIMQTGFSTYEPKFCKYSKFIPYKEVVQNVSDARIVITHGGPASFIMPLQIGKIPIVVPRLFKYDEHVNNHQVEFAKAVVVRNNNIIVVENIEELNVVISNYSCIVHNMNKYLLSENKKFCNNFEKIIENIFN